MGKGFFHQFLSGLDCCEREFHQIFHFKGRIKTMPFSKNNTCTRCNPHQEHDENECECECECDCVCKCRPSHDHNCF